jgi:hypothetical protein
MDLNSTEYISMKKEKEYSTQDKESGYWGHEFEFRAFANEIINGIYTEYKDKINKIEDQTLLDSIDSMISYFGKSGQLDKIGQRVLYDISSEGETGELPYILKVARLLKTHAPQRWNTFLKMLYNVGEENLRLNKPKCLRISKNREKWGSHIVKKPRVKTWGLVKRPLVDRIKTVINN